MCIYLLFSHPVHSLPAQDTIENWSDQKTSAVVSDQTAPELKHEPAYDIPLKVLKEGLSGIVAVATRIDSNGTVESCSLLVSSGSLLDSITKAHVLSSSFSPSTRQGKPAASIVHLEMDYVPEEMVKTFAQASPQLHGKISDKETGKPIYNARINMQYVDTLTDTTITIGHDRYCRLAGTLEGQSYANMIFSTFSDLGGSFSLRLLPSGRVYVAVIAPGYKTQKFAADINELKSLSVQIRMETYIDENRDYEIVVYGKKDVTVEEVDIEEAQTSVGLTNSLGEIVRSHTMINRSSRSKSEMLVRGGNPYDNVYLIRGVPLLSPYHFGGCAIGDIDALSVANISDMQVVINSVAGHYPSVGGVVIEANPDISRDKDGAKYKRPEVIVDFSNTSADILYSSQSRRKPKRFLQIGFKGANAYMLKWNRARYDLEGDAQSGIGFPVGFGDLTLNGELHADKFRLNSYGWFAWDSYSDFEPDPNDPFEIKGTDKTIPWGMAAVEFHPKRHKNVTFSAGGSRQYFAKGKRVWNNSFLNTTYLTNATITGIVRDIEKGNAAADIRVSLDHETWSGDLKQRDHSFGIDKGESRLSQRIGGHVHGNLEYDLNAFTFGARLLGAVKFFGSEPEFICDPGVSVSWTADALTAGVSSGLVTSFPDFRGLPDKKLERTRLKSFISSMQLYYTGLAWLKLHVEPYMRIQDKSPIMNPVTFTWQDIPGGIFAKGVDARLDITPQSPVSPYVQVNVTDAHRRSKGKGKNEDRHDIYEWEIPYTLKGGVHTRLLDDKLHLYLHGFIRDGNYYYDLLSQDYKRIETQAGYTFSAQIRMKDIKHRYFYRWDLYTTAKNFFISPTVKDYYWDESKVAGEIIAEGYELTIGLKAGFRL